MGLRSGEGRDNTRSFQRRRALYLAQLAGGKLLVTFRWNRASKESTVAPALYFAMVFESSQRTTGKACAASFLILGDRGVETPQNP